MDVRLPISGWQQPEIVNSGGVSIVVVQHTAQTLAAQHRSTTISLACIGHKQLVAETLMVSLAVIMQKELVNSLAQ